MGRGIHFTPPIKMFVESLLASCTPDSVIAREVAKRFPGATEKHARRWIKETYERLALEAKPRDKVQRRAVMRSAFQDFYQKALLARNFNSAVIALDRLAKLDGLYAAEQLDVRHAGLLERDPDKIRERIAKLAAKNPHLVQAAQAPEEPTPPEDLN